MRLPHSTFLSCFMIVTFSLSGLVLAKAASNIEYRQLSGIDKGSGDSSGGGGKIEKPIYIKNYCPFKARITVAYKNKTGEHEIKQTLAQGEKYKSGKKATAILGGSCKNISRNTRCKAAFDKLARRWKISSCK